MIAPNARNGTVELFDYPAGGKPVKTLAKNLSSPFGATLSIAK